MACERISRPQLLIAALVAVLVALWTPAVGHAAERDKLASAGLLARGAGYGTAGGSDYVRILQRRLRQLGTSPGPIDGLYGPLTEGAVERFQERHGLAVDGMVGRQTKRSLSAAGRPVAAPPERETRPGTLARKSPAPKGAESASEHPHAQPLPAGVASRDGPAPASGVPPEVIAALVALGALLLILTLRRQGEVRLNVGLTCAALLGVFGIGAVAGAVFATRAAPQEGDGAVAQSGLLLADAPARGARAQTLPRHPRIRQRRSSTTHAQAVAAPAPAAGVSVAPAPPPSVPPAPPAPSPEPTSPLRRAGPATYVVKPGDSLSNIARRELSADSDERVVAEVQKLTELNADGRIESGDPDVLEAGEKLRLP